VPVLSDVGHFDKPPLIYWLTGSSILLFGKSELAARLPSALGALLTLTGIGLLAARRGGARAAWWGVLAGATTFHFWALSHLLSPDMLMCGFATLGAALALKAEPGRPKGWLWWSAGALCWSLAWWTKATACLVPLGALALALRLTGQTKLLAALRPVRLLLVILLLGSPWYVAMMLRFEELRDFFLHRELAGRITGHQDGRHGFPGFHVVVAMVLWLPWWPMLLVPARRGWSRWKSAPWAERLTSLPWEPVAAVGVVLIFSVISSKLMTYVLPGMPYLAAYVGHLLAQRQPATLSLKRPALQVAGGAALIAIAVSYFAPKLESSLGSNSSLRHAVSAARDQGAGWIVCRNFWPGAEFYFGEGVWYVDVKDILQASDIRGQIPTKHFLSKREVSDRVGSVEDSVWLIQGKQSADDLQKWERILIENRPDPEQAPLTVGNFLLWRVR
ncbi:MAG: glycosyltransferase family 39 protein, partial [Verrucomicrobiae bacterium]|nr:glycosyltransferase family 39 protein [Verrucomicrobiae bacterium]